MNESTLIRGYRHQFDLKYGCNPHQKPAAVYLREGSRLPFKVLNGAPGYINLLDALNAWQLVRELRQALNLPAAASFKHVSPAGVGLAVPLSVSLAEAYEATDKELTPQALAYLRAREADPKSSFGDFAAMSDPVDLATAQLLKTEVSDGVIAPGYEPGTLQILQAKKGGNYIVLEANPDYEPPVDQIKEVFGVMLAETRNAACVDPNQLGEVVSTSKVLPQDAVRDLTLAAITVKYTQSNSVGFALDGQLIGVGAGQQSRVDCTRLAGSKVDVWFLRQHPQVVRLPFKAGTKRGERTNGRVRYVEGDFTAPEHQAWEALFDTAPEPLTAEDKEGWLAQLQRVALASDAFFPFRDSIDQAAKRGVAYIWQPGGSIADETVIHAANEYGMVMACSGLRLFHH